MSEKTQIVRLKTDDRRYLVDRVDHDAGVVYSEFEILESELVDHVEEFKLTDVEVTDAPACMKCGVEMLDDEPFCEECFDDAVEYDPPLY